MIVGLCSSGQIDVCDGAMVDAGVGVDDKLAEMRRMYEPFVAALSEYLLMPLPAWRAGEPARANWRASR